MFQFRFFCCLLLCSGVLIFQACNTSDVLPSSSGKSGEVIVVIDSLMWKSEAGKSLYDSLTVEFPAIPQYEPCFKVVNIIPGNFKSILQLHRNILIVEIGPLNDDKRFALTMKKNVWSEPQIVMNLRISSIDFFNEAMLTFSSTIRTRFQEEELSRAVLELKERLELQVTRDVKEKLKISVPLSEDYFVASTSAGYCWIRKETVHSSIGFQIYRMPYLNEDNFTRSFMLALRDSLSKKHIPGPTNGSYMISDTSYTTLITQTEIAGKFGVEIRGLWRTYGDFMGGPFISYLINDEASGELIFIDGYVYAPKFNKKEYVKHIEATVHAIEIY